MGRLLWRWCLWGGSRGPPRECAGVSRGTVYSGSPSSHQGNVELPATQTEMLAKARQEILLLSMLERFFLLGTVGVPLGSIYIWSQSIGTRMGSHIGPIWDPLCGLRRSPNGNPIWSPICILFYITIFILYKIKKMQYHDFRLCVCLFRQQSSRCQLEMNAHIL